MRALYCALLHYPVRDRTQQIVTTAVTNLDVHDLARIARTYGLGGYFVVTPIAAQQRLVEGILEHWRVGAGRLRVPDRAEALSICATATSLDAVIDRVQAAEGMRPVVWATAARTEPGLEPCGFASARQQLREDGPPVVLAFGTGHGLATEVLQRAARLLSPVRPRGYNHLSVRTAAAIVVDRLIGDEESATVSGPDVARAAARA